MVKKPTSKPKVKVSRSEARPPTRGQTQPIPTVPVARTGPPPAEKNPKRSVPAKKIAPQPPVAAHVPTPPPEQAAPRPAVKKPAAPVADPGPPPRKREPKRAAPVPPPATAQKVRPVPVTPTASPRLDQQPGVTPPPRVPPAAPGSAKPTPPTAAIHPEQNELRSLIASVIDPPAAGASRPTTNDAHPAPSPQGNLPERGTPPAACPNPTARDKAARDKAILNGGLFAKRLQSSLVGTADVSFEACLEHARLLRSEQFFSGDRGERYLLEQIEFVAQKSGSMHAYVGSIKESDKEQLTFTAAACRLSRELASLLDSLARHRKSRMEFEIFRAKRSTGENADR